MIGILCEKKNKDIYSEKFYKLLNINIKNKWEDIIIFSISDINFENKTVSGKLIARNGIKSVTASIPDIINNFLNPRKKVSKKKIKTFAETDGKIIINEVNHFKRNMIMEMLRSSAKTKELVPGGPCNETLTGTVHSIRTGNNEWKVLPVLKDKTSRTSKELKRLIRKSALEISVRIGSFIPSLTFCTAKIILDENKRPFLTALSGWDRNILLKRQNRKFSKTLIKYFFDYSYLLAGRKAGTDHVD